MVCKPNEGVLPPNTSLTISIAIYNEISGYFFDKLISEVKGLDPVNFPVNLFIRGSPLIIPVNQVGLDIQSTPPLLNLGGMQLNAEPIVKGFKLENIGTSDLEVNLKTYNVGEMDPQRDQFNIKILPPRPGSTDLVNVKWDPIEPEESLDGPFKVIPNRCIIKSKTVATFQVEYYLNEEKKCNSVITATPKLINSSNNENHLDFDLGCLAVKLRAETFLPKLELNKLPGLNGNILYKFHKWSAEKCPKQARTILLINKLASHLYFDLRLSGPFSFLSATKS